MAIANHESGSRWHLYVRWPTQKKFRPVNWRNGYQVKLIHATVFTDTDRQKAIADMQQTQADNVGMEWEFRPI